MDVEKLKDASGVDLDAAGVELKLDRATMTRGHAFDEVDDSYRRRLVAVIAGAAAADALSQPAVTAEESGPKVTLDDGTVVRGKAAEEILRLRGAGEHTGPVSTETKLPELKQDGPTVEEWVLAGMDAKRYPPHGYASRSNDAEIEAAIAAQDAAKSHIPADEQQGDGQQSAEPKPEPNPEQGSAGDPAKPLP